MARPVSTKHIRQYSDSDITIDPTVNVDYKKIGITGCLSQFTATTGSGKQATPGVTLFPQACFGVQPKYKLGFNHKNDPNGENIIGLQMRFPMTSMETVESPTKEELITIQFDKNLHKKMVAHAEADLQRDITSIAKWEAANPDPDPDAKPPHVLPNEFIAPAEQAKKRKAGIGSLVKHLFEFQKTDKKTDPTKPKVCYLGIPAKQGKDKEWICESKIFTQDSNGKYTKEINWKETSGVLGIAQPTISLRDGYYSKTYGPRTWVIDILWKPKAMSKIPAERQAPMEMDEVDDFRLSDVANMEVDEEDLDEDNDPFGMSTKKSKAEVNSKVLTSNAKVGKSSVVRPSRK